MKNPVSEANLGRLEKNFSRKKSINHKKQATPKNRHAVIV
jgi:hypothetical protein